MCMLSMGNVTRYCLEPNIGLVVFQLGIKITISLEDEPMGTGQWLGPQYRLSYFLAPLALKEHV